MTGTNTTAQTSRRRLLNMANGGDGHLTSWIERVTLEASPQADEQTAYVFHSVTPDGSPDGEYMGSIEQCRKFYMLPYLELPENEQPDVNAIRIEDNGRRIPATLWQRQMGAYRMK